MPITFGDLTQDNPFLPRRPAPIAGPAVLSGDDSDTLGGLMEGGLGGLAYLGKVLDKTFGGRAVRGLAGGAIGVPRRGGIRELFSVLPFSDTLGITNEQDTVHGIDLLNTLGVTTPGDDSFGNTVAGVGAEIALDPAMYFGAGVPKLVAGALSGTSRGVGAGVQALAGFNPHNLAARGLGAVRDTVVPPLRSLFDTSVAGSTIGAVQDNVAAPVFTPALQAGQAAVKVDEANALVRLSKYTEGAPGAQAVINRALTQVGEGLHGNAIDTLISGGFSMRPEAGRDILKIGNELRRQAAATLPAERAEGRLSAQLQDLPDWKIKQNEAVEASNLANGTSTPLPWNAEVKYFPRSSAPFPGSDQPFGRVSAGNAGSASEFQLGRDDFLRGIRGGTVQLDDWARNQQLSGAARALSPDDATRVFAEHIMGQPVTAFPVSHPVYGQARKLADFYERLSPAALTNGLFNLDAVGNVTARGLESARLVASAKSAMKTVDPAVGFVKPVHEFEAAGQPFVRVTDFLDSNILRHADSVTGAPASREVVAGLLGLDTTNPHWQRVLAEYAIPRDVAVDVSRMGQAWVTPEAMRPVIEGYDSAVNTFKTGLTVPFLAFHARNLISGLFNMWRDGINPLMSMSVGRDVFNMIRGGQISPETAAKLYPGLNPAEATKQLLKEYLANGIAFVRGGQTAERVGGEVPVLSRGMLAKDVPVVGADIPRPITEDVGQWFQKLAGEGGEGTSWRRPLGIAGVMGNTIDTNPIVAAGRALGNTVEDWLRGTHFLSKRLGGATTADAKLGTMKYQIDYADLTPFEREVMKRIFPWYAFSRKNLPPILSDLVEKPALLAGATHIATGSRNQGDFVPPWVAEGSSVRIPGAPDGNQRFISSFGLPIEDEAIKTIGAGLQMDPRRFFQQLFGMAQPFVKLPAEIATSTQMFSGRRLEELRPYEFTRLGGILPEDLGRKASQVIANSPASRFFSTGDKFLDDRKGLLPTLLNLGTGVRVTDVDEAAVKERAAADLLRTMLRGHPGVRSRDDVYVPADQRPSLRPDDLMKYDLLKDIEARQAARGRALIRERGAP